MKGVVRNIQNMDLYFYLGENKFQNIRTGAEGVVTDEMAKKIFQVDISATFIINEYPEIGELIKKLSLKIDNDKK